MDVEKGKILHTHPDLERATNIGQEHAIVHSEHWTEAVLYMSGQSIRGRPFDLLHRHAKLEVLRDIEEAEENYVVIDRDHRTFVADKMDSKTFMEAISAKLRICEREKAPRKNRYQMLREKT
jgi:hypothetical protein